jgi:hypothetical protein
MAATISPHDATPNDQPTFTSKVLDVAWRVVAFPFITDGELKWATGILSVDDDFESCAIHRVTLHEHTTTILSAPHFSFSSERKCMHNLYAALHCCKNGY